MNPGYNASSQTSWQSEDGADGFPGGSHASALAVDLDLLCDANFVVRRVSVEPAGLRCSGRSLLDAVVSDDRKRLREAVETVSAGGGPVRLSVRLNVGDAPTALLGVAAREGELPLGVSGIYLEASQTMFGASVDEASLYRRLIDRLPVAVFFKDTETRFVGVNDHLVRTLGQQDAHELLGKTDASMHHPDEVELYQRTDRQVMTSGVAVTDLTEVQTRGDGSINVMHTSKFPVYDRGGDVVGLMGFSRDVTESTRVVEQLVESEQRYALATRATRDGIWDFDVETEQAFFSPRCCELLNVPVTADPVEWIEIARRLRPEHVMPLANAVQSLRDDPNGLFSETVCVQLDDGGERWVQLIGTSLAVDGDVVRVIGSAADITEERANIARLEYLATHDPLTGLVNRRSIVECINETLEVDGSGAVMMLDLDYFKVINDSLGHQAGDEVLQTVSSRLRSALDAETVIARFGGDEFAVFVQHESRTEVLRAAHVVLSGIREEMTILGLDLYTTASIGVVFLDDLHDHADQVLRDADIALYAAKFAGKARICVFEQSMRDAAEDALEQQMSVRRAVHNMDFALVYQPIIRASDSTWAGVEALLRLAPESGAVKSPAEFLPYLEQTDLIIDVGEWVIQTALSDLARWKREGQVPENFVMTLNVSRKQFQTDRLAGFILESLGRFGLAGSDIVLEITETAVLHTETAIVEILETLRDVGVKIAIDDFGTGQSSLAVLHDLPVDILKIDKSFTDRILAQDDEPVITAALEVARSMGLVTVAEGVEFQRQADWLRSHRCDLLQGFLFSRPVPADQLLVDLAWRQLG